MNQEVICIVCPKGCHINVSKDSEGYNFKNQGCTRGPKYVIDEINDPKRMLSSTIEIEEALIRRLPIVTSKAIPKNMIFNVIKELTKCKVKAPIYVDDIIIKNILNLNVDIIATRTLVKVDK